MKKFAKVSLIICLLFACIGAACLCAGIVLGSGPGEVMEIVKQKGIHIGNFHIGEGEVVFGDDEAAGEVLNGMLVKQFDGDEVDSLDIEIQYGEVYFITGSTDQIEINIDAPKRNSYICKNDGGTVTLEDETARRWWRNSKNDVIVTISLPKQKKFRKIELTTNLGAVDISASLLAEEISLELDAGEMTVEELTAEEELSAEVGAGRLEISRFSAKSIEVDCGLGEARLCGQLLSEGDINCGMGTISLELEEEEEAYNYELECGMGEITLNDRSFTSLGSGQEIRHHHTEKEIHLDCGMGTIAVTTK